MNRRRRENANEVAEWSGEKERAEALRAIRAVANGEVIFGPGLARRVMGLFSVEMPKAPQAFRELTEREQEMRTSA